MEPTRVVVGGLLKPDGTLTLDERVTLPAGRVQVVVQAAGSASTREDTWRVLEQVWDQQRGRGATARSKEEIDAEISAMRDEGETRMREVERLHQEAHDRRGHAPC